jgi:hypothetical protein
MSKKKEKAEGGVDLSDIQFSTFDKALFGTLFAMSKVCCLYITTYIASILFSV